MKPHELTVAVSLGIAAASLVVVPALVAIGRRLWVAWREAQTARLSKLFVPREEIEMNFAELQRKQQQQHAENRDFLDTIRTEAHQRETKILDSIEGVATQNRDESRRLGTDIATVGARVDRLFERLGSGRR